MWESLLWLLVGAVIGFLPTWFLTNRSHKWELEEKKSEREYAAREIRLKEGEDKIQDYASEFYYLEKMANQIITAKSEVELQAITKTVDGYDKRDEEMDKRSSINELSIKSIEDKQLTISWEKVDYSIHEYGRFVFYLTGLFSEKGITAIQKGNDNYSEKEKALKQNYLSSVVEFLHRINELRSQ